MSEQFADESLAFLYKAAASRGPGKRQVRVVSRERLLANFESLGAASDDEEDDEDFKPEENADDSGSDDVVDESSSGEEQDNDDDEDDEKCQESSTKRISSPSKIRQDRAEAESLSPPPDLKAEQEEQENLICSLCLNLRFHEQGVDQCDRCGLCVHEACYGASDDWAPQGNDDEAPPPLTKFQLSISGNETTSGNNTDSDSDNQTEPWFCEPCSAGLNPRPNGNVYCELCPVLGGAFKRTDGGRWVHSLCAFYVPRVTFGDVEKLSRVSLRDVQPSRYGAKPCVYCPDKLTARVGVSVKCDAGLCKAHAHVTCAHKRGLLVDAGASNSANQGHAPSGYGWAAHGDAMADPYYFCCPMHSDRSSVTLKKKRFASVELHEKSSGARTLSARENQKLQSKIAQFKNISAKQNKGESVKSAERDGENIEKRPCFLSSRWEFLSKIRQKTLLMDETLNEKLFAENFRAGLNLVACAATGPKYVLPPAFTVDFINYYHARENLLQELSSKVAKFPDTVTESKNEELQLNDDIQKIQKQLDQLSKENRNKRDLLHRWYNMLKQLDCKNMPQVFAPTLASSNVQASSVSKSPKKFPSSMPKLDHFSATTNTRPSSTKPVLVPSVPVVPQSPALASPRLLPQHNIFECSTCKKKHDQHRLIYCETCEHRFHLQCLDPPLAKMPRLSARYAWECSACFNKKQELEAEAYEAMENGEKHVEENDTNDQKRQLRTVHKPVNRLLAESPKDENRTTKKRMRQASSKPKDASPMKALEPPLKRVKRGQTDPLPGSPKIAISTSAQNDSLKPKDVSKPVPIAPAPFKVEQILNRYRQLTLAHRAKMAAASQNSVTTSPKLQILSNTRKSTSDCSPKTTVNRSSPQVGKLRRNSLPLPPVKTLIEQRNLVKSLEKSIPVAVVPPARSPKVSEGEQTKVDSPTKSDKKKAEEKIIKEEKIDETEDDEHMDELLSKILFTEDGTTASSGQEEDDIEDREIDGFQALVPGRQRQYSTINLSKAVSSVMTNRLSAVQAANKYNVPRSTVLRYCRRLGFTGSGGGGTRLSTPKSSASVAAGAEEDATVEHEREEDQNLPDGDDQEENIPSQNEGQIENSSNQNEDEEKLEPNPTNQNEDTKNPEENSSNEHQDDSDVQKPAPQDTAIGHKMINVADLDAHNYSSPKRQNDDLLSQILRNKAASASKKNGNHVTDHHSSVGGGGGKSMVANNSAASPSNSHRKLSYHSLPNPDDNVQIIRVEDL